ncbi:MAG: hypothetical protein IKN25_02905, partial [Spirochaetales bacterium]|nr:hypothetical protein [Spirochaetales bacterium]
ISFTDRAVTNQEFRISQRNAKYNIRFDYGADKPFILTNKTNGTEKNFGITGNASPLYSAQVTDSDGNLYFIHHSSKDNRISLVGIRYDGLTKLITGDNNISILQYMLIDPTDDVTVINRQYIRLAMYEKGSTKHLFVLQNQLWDMTHDYNQETETLTYYNPNIICLNVTTTTTGDLTMDAIGKAQIKFDNAYTFAQALTVDDDENLHIGINKFEIKDDAGQIYIDFGDSVVNKYYFKPMQANPDGLSYPPFELQIKNEKSYKDYHINTIYTITKPIANPTLYQILSNYTFGLEIIIIQ